MSTPPQQPHEDTLATAAPRAPSFFNDILSGTTAIHYAATNQPPGVENDAFTWVQHPSTTTLRPQSPIIQHIFLRRLSSEESDYCPDSPNVRIATPTLTPQGIPIGTKRARSDTGGDDTDEVVAAAASSGEEPQAPTLLEDGYASGFSGTPSMWPAQMFQSLEELLLRLRFDQFGSWPVDHSGPEFHDAVDIDAFMWVQHLRPQSPSLDAVEDDAVEDDAVDDANTFTFTLRPRDGLEPRYPVVREWDVVRDSDSPPGEWYEEYGGWGEWLGEGVPEDQLRDLPTFHVRDVAEGASECSICMCAMSEQPTPDCGCEACGSANPTLTAMPRCGHVFHHVCLRRWLYSSTACPLCRGEFPETTTPN